MTGCYESRCSIQVSISSSIVNSTTPNSTRCAIRVSAEQATITGQRIFTVFREDRIQLRELGRQAPAALLIQEALQSKPLATIAALAKSTGLTTPTVTQALRALEQENSIRETTGRARGRIFSYVRYLDALNSE